jgi:hypothetical protein
MGHWRGETGKKVIGENRRNLAIITGALVSSSQATDKKPVPQSESLNLSLRLRIAKSPSIAETSPFFKGVSSSFRCQEQTPPK